MQGSETGQGGPLNNPPKVLGICGGMGPFASAEFLKTIYELNPARVEQELPKCILYSDPSLVDRTESVKTGDKAALTNRLVEILEQLDLLGSDKIVVCCVTSHCFLSSVPPRLHEKLISLVDLIVDEAIARRKKHLMLCTIGARLSGVFKNHERWPEAERYIVFPAEEEQCTIHNMIYRLKLNPDDDSAIPCLERLLEKYRLDAFISGCTEIHLLTRQLMRRGRNVNRCSFIDPLLMVASDLDRLLMRR